MHEMNDESLLARVSQAFLKPRPFKDERLFTSRVMAQIRQLQPADASWPIFIRWSIPALVLSFGGFVLALTHFLEPRAPRADAVVMGERDETPSIDWIASAPDSDDSSMEEVANS